MTTAKKPRESAREEYYAELASLEPDERLQEAIAAARASRTQQRLVEAWRGRATGNGAAHRTV